MGQGVASMSRWGIGRQLGAAALFAAFVSTRSLSSFYPLFDILGPATPQGEIYESYAALQVVTALLLIGILAARKPLAPLLCKRWLVVFAAGCGTCGALALLAGQALGWTFFGILGLLLMAVYPALYLPTVGLRLSKLDLRDACVVVAVTFAFAELYRFLFLLVPAGGAASIFLFPLVAGAVVTLLPPAEEGSAKAAQKDRNVSGTESSSPTGTNAILLFTSAALLCILSAIFSRLLSNPTIDSIAFDERALTLYATIVVFISLAIVVRFAPLSIDTLTLLYAFCAFVFLTALTSTVFLAFQGITANGVALLKTTQRIFEAFIMTSILFIVKSTRISPVTAFSLYGIFVIAVLNLLSNGIAAPANQFFEIYQSPQVIPMTALVTLFSLIAISATLAVIFLRRSKEHRVTAKEYNSRLCESAGQDNGLSPREIEVMQYLYQGYSVSKIAEKMFIATSTVQGHSRSIYRKMDVHSRQELIDRINERFV